MLQCTQFPHVTQNLLLNVHTLHKALELIIVVSVITSASLCGGLGSIPGDFMCDSWGTNWY
jgi:hypothetical protein